MKPCSHYSTISEQSPGSVDFGHVKIWNLFLQCHLLCWGWFSLFLCSSFLLSFSPSLPPSLPCLPASPSPPPPPLHFLAFSWLPSLPSSLSLQSSLPSSLSPFLSPLLFLFAVFALFFFSHPLFPKLRTATRNLSCWETSGAVERPLGSPEALMALWPLCPSPALCPRAGHWVIVPSLPVASFVCSCNRYSPSAFYVPAAGLAIEWAAEQTWSLTYIF